MSEEVPLEKQPRSRRRWVQILLLIAALYLLVAYLVLPAFWKLYSASHPSFDDHPRITETNDGHPGDPLNVALIGSQQEILRIMRHAAWNQAAALGVTSDLKIAADTVLSRPDEDAPVSSLYLFGRKEDLAFEKPVGDNPRQRHHVRFWKTDRVSSDSRPIWIGAASYDQRVGLSHTTGEITHHIAADVDAEREHLFNDLKASNELADEYSVDDFHTHREGKNGGGDRWYTDGKLLVGVVAANAR